VAQAALLLRFAHRRFAASEIRFRPAALSRRRFGFAAICAVFGGRPRRRGVEMPFTVAMALSSRSR